MKILAAALILVASVGLTGSPASAQVPGLPPGGTFWDDDGHISQGSIEAVVAAGLMRGCNSPYYDMFCPDRTLTRAEVAHILTQAFDPPTASDRRFFDVVGRPFAVEIGAVTAAGMMNACSEGRFCPDTETTREDLAVALAVALDLPDIEFTLSDVPESGPGAAIRAVVDARIMLPCDLGNRAFCPAVAVTRGEMAFHLLRAIGLTPIYPPPPTMHMMSSFTTYHPCCLERVRWVHDAADRLNGMVLNPNRTFSMLAVIDNRVHDGNCQTATTLFNAFYWAGLDEVDHLPHDYNFVRYPDALEATLVPYRQDLKFRNDTGRPVEIRAHYTGTSVTLEIWGNNHGRSVSGDYSPTGGYVMEVLEEGGPSARIVSSEVERIGPRTYQATRTITVDGVSRSESWTFKYNTGF